MTAEPGNTSDHPLGAGGGPASAFPPPPPPGFQASAPPSSTPAADWYPDPQGGSGLRYWDGTQWTEHRSSPQPAPGSPHTPAGSIQWDQNIFSLIAMVLGAIALLFFPIVFGIVGIVLAAVATSKAERLRHVALAVSIGGTVLGFILGALVWSATYY